MLTAMLVGTLQVSVVVAASANAIVAHFLAAMLSGALALVARLNPRAFPSVRGVSIVLALLLICAHVGVTHAASRLGAAAGLLVVPEVVHLLAAAIWIGGIPYFLVALGMTTNDMSRRMIASKFSRNAVWSVAALIVCGLLMMTHYTSALAALYETNYGLLISTKIALLFGLLCFGAANRSTVRELWRVPTAPLRRLSRFAEVEVGLGVVALFCAAALASSSLPIDGGEERASLSEMTARFTPRWPSFESPAYAALSAAHVPFDVSSVSEATVESANSGPPTAADIAWAETKSSFGGSSRHTNGGFRILEHDRESRRWRAIGLCYFCCSPPY